MLNLIGNIVGGNSSPQIVGTILSETSFANASDFPITGTGISRGSGKLDLTGNPTLFSSYVKYDSSSSPYRYTGMEHWKQRVRFKTPTSITTTSYGIGIGVQSANGFDNYSTFIRWSNDTGGPNALGSLYLYYKLQTAGQIFSSGSFTPVANTYYWIEVERIKNQIKFTLFSDALSQLFTETLSFSLASGYVQQHNVGQFGIHLYGGTAMEVTDWEVTSTVQKGLDYCVIGDSNTYGLFVTSNSNRWVEQAMLAANKTYTINAGISDRTADVILKLPEIIALRPKNVILTIGRNDVANGVPIGTIQTNINTIISTLEAANIVVKLAGVAASSVDVSGVQTHYSSKGNQQVNFYTLTKSGTTTLNAIYNSGDNIHLNLTGNNVCSSEIQTIL